MLALLLATLTVPTPSPSPSPTPLPIISSVRVATGSRQSLHTLPVAAAVLDRAAIASSAALSSDGLLRTLPGFDRTRSNSLFTNYGQLRVSFAGAGTDRGLVMADGIPAQDGFGGQVDWAAYPVSVLQRTELLLGAASALYGSGAVGGVLDMQTFAPPSATSQAAGDVVFSGGTRAYSQQWSNANASLTPALSAAISLQQQRMEYFALPPAYSTPIDKVSQADASMAQVRLRYAPGSRDSYEFAQLNAWDDQFEGRPNYTFSRRLSQSSLRYAHATPKSAVETTLFARTGFIINATDQFPNKPGVLRYVQNVPTNESGASAMWTIGGEAFTFALRADARNIRGENDQYGTLRVLQSSGSGSQNIGGIGAQGTWRAQRFEALAGARLDMAGSYDQQISGTTEPNAFAAAISPRIALRYDASSAVAVRASSGAGFRPPFLNELVRGFFIGNVAMLPNPALVPERSWTNSAGVDVISPDSRIAIDLFDTSVTNAIVFRTIDPTHQIRSNIGDTKTNAYVISYTRGLGRCSRVAAWFDNEDARITSGAPAVAGKRLPYVPAQSASVDYAGQIGKTGVGLSVAYLGQAYADDLNLQPLGTAVVLGSTVRIPMSGGGSVVLAAQNLTDARYLSSIDRYAPPAVVSISFSMPIGTDTHTPACL